MPAEIIAHCGAHGIIPVTAVIAEICPLYGVKHIICVICFESKAVAARAVRLCRRSIATDGKLYQQKTIPLKI